MAMDVSNASEALRSKTEERLLRGYVTSLLSTSAVIDKFSTWLMVAIGASVTLVISNIASITSIVSSENVRWALIILILAGLFGFLEKVISRDIQVNMAQDESLQKILSNVFADYKQRKGLIQGLAEVEGKKVDMSIDIIGVLDQYAALHPWLVKRKLRKYPPLSIVLKKNVHRYYWQSAWAVIELLLFVGFIFIMALSL